MTGARDAEGIQSRREAQETLERVRTFQAELRDLEDQGILALTEEQRAGLRAHHDHLRKRLGERFDADASGEGRRLSWGMAIASLLGALAFGAAVFFAFYRFWGHFPTVVQVGILVAAPVLTVLLTDRIARRERTPWFTNLAALIALATAVLNLRLLGGIYNIPDSPNALAVWAAFALVLAYGYGLRVPLFLGLLFVLGYVTAALVAWGGTDWVYLQRPENLAAGGVLLVAVGAWVPHRRRPEFAPTYRVLGLTAVFLPLLGLSNWGRYTYLPLPVDLVELVYLVAAFGFSAGVIAVGVRQGIVGVANAGVVFFVILLLDKFYDWCWDWLPKYLFFLVVGLLAVAVLWSLGRIRSALAEAPA